MPLDDPTVREELRSLIRDAVIEALQHVPRDTDLLTKDEVKELLGINEHTFYRYRREHPAFKTFRTGRHTKMRRSTLDAFIAELEERQDEERWK